MTTNQRIKQSKLANAAAAKKAIKAANHARLMERQSAIKQYEAAFALWCEAEEGLRREAEERGEMFFDTKSIGPCPLNPRFYDRKLFPENFED